ncbi:MAG: hypothetical protein LBF23_00685 [Endomicrobium sp.]|jgi:hypothetical protein|nr:hypothetical protein [Endomicrobium sp.]
MKKIERIIKLEAKEIRRLVGEKKETDKEMLKVVKEATRKERKLKTH